METTRLNLQVRQLIDQKMHNHLLTKTVSYIVVVTIFALLFSEFFGQLLDIKSKLISFGLQLAPMIFLLPMVVSRDSKRKWLQKEIADHKRWFEAADEQNMFRPGHMLYLQQCEWLLETEFKK